MAVVARVASLTVFARESAYRLVPRSLTSGGFLREPGWLDLAVLALFVVALGDFRSSRRPAAPALGAAALDALFLLAFPLLMGLSLFLYVQRWLVTPTLDGMLLLRFLEFVLAFVAMNLFMDRLPVTNRWARRGVALVLVAALAFTQDLVLAADASWY